MKPLTPYQEASKALTEVEAELTTVTAKHSAHETLLETTWLSAPNSFVQWRQYAVLLPKRAALKAQLLNLTAKAAALKAIRNKAKAKHADHSQQHPA